MDIDIEKCQITHYPSVVLSKPAARIDKIDDSIRLLVDKMTDIMLANKGIGPAGPQAGVPLKIFIVSLEANRESVKVYINPTVTPSGELDSLEEGCLSVPGISTKIRRYKRCTVTATDLDGNEFTQEAEGLLARVFQHENDHLEGVTIVNRLDQTQKIAHRRQLKKLVEKHDKKSES